MLPNEGDAWEEWGLRPGESLLGQVLLLDHSQSGRQVLQSHVGEVEGLSDQMNSLLIMALGSWDNSGLGY